MFGDAANPNAGRIRYYNNDNSMRFVTNDSDRLIIKSSGNIGIGVTDPDTKLEVVGTGSFHGGLVLRNDTAAPTNGESEPPALRFTGFGWDTNSGSDPIEGRIELKADYGADGGSGATQGRLTFSVRGSGGSGDSSEVLTEYMGITGNGVVTFPGTNTKISGSATSTGSFGQVHAADKIGVMTTTPGAVSPASPHTGNKNLGIIEIRAGASGADAALLIRRFEGDGVYGMDLWTDTNATDNYIDSRSGVSASQLFIRVATHTSTKNAAIFDYLGNVEFPTATSISGSSTSTGSFGALTIGGSALNANLISGRVGIGTTSPGAKLDIRAATGEDALHCYDRNGAIMFEIDQFGQILSYNGIANTNSSGTAWTFSTGATTVLKLDQNSRTSLSNNDSGLYNTIFGKLAGDDLASGGNGNAFFGENAGHGNTTGDYNVALGLNAYRFLPTGNNNIAIGLDAMAAQDGTANGLNDVVAIGFEAFKGTGAGTSGPIGSVAIGSKSLKALTTGVANTAVGFESGVLLTTGGYNAVLGYQALSNDTDGLYNVAIGWKAGRNMTGATANVMIGYQAMANIDNNPGDGVANCVAIGYQAFLGSDNNTTGTTTDANGTIAIGQTALKALTTGQQNTAVGYQALSVMTELDSNTAVGYQALKLASGSAGGGHNVAIGAVAGAAITSGEYNIMIGSRANGQATSANGNITVGYFAGWNTRSGSFNTMIGEQSGYQFQNGGDSNNSFNTYLGAQSGYNNKLGAYNTYIGGNAGKGSGANSNSSNTGVGFDALKLITTAVENTVVGASAGAAITTGNGNALLGHNAGTSLNIGSANIGIGEGALPTDDVGKGSVAIGKGSLQGQNIAGASEVLTKNVGIGYQPLYYNVTGLRNVAIGYRSQFGASAQSHDDNTSIGSNALYAITTAADNTVVGSDAGAALTSGASNVFIGKSAGATPTTATRSILIGATAGTNLTAGVAISSVIAIGYGALTGTGTQTTDINHTIAIGTSTLANLESGIGNVAVGYEALKAEDDGDFSTAIGYQALVAQTGTSGTVANTAIGHSALKRPHFRHNEYSSWIPLTRL